MVSSDPDKGRDFTQIKGSMVYNGKTIRPKKLKESTSSNGITVYVTTLWEDNYVSCTCPGWTVKKGSQPRACKHTKASVAINFSDMKSPAQIVRAQLVANVQLPESKPESDDRMVEL